jgi:hypothetical protein
MDTVCDSPDWQAVEGIRDIGCGSGSADPYLSDQWIRIRILLRIRLLSSATSRMQKKKNFP